MGKKIIFLNKKVENLEILHSKRDFFNFLHAITFDISMLVNWSFLTVYICSILGILQENKESSSYRLIQKP